MPTVGLRNAHDQTFAMGIAGGMQVLVCSNLSFCGDMVFKRKHTRFIERDIHGLVAGGVSYLEGLWANQRKQVEAYRNSRLSDLRAHDLSVRALDQNVLPASQLPEVLREWREPSHEEFAPRTLWSWFNACTEVLKQRANPFALPGRTKALHGLCDAHIGLDTYQAA